MFQTPIISSLLSRLAMFPFAVAACWAVDATSEEKTVIAEGNSVSIEYTLKLDDGTTVDSNVDGEPMVYKVGGSEILPALESALHGLGVGDTKEVRLTAEQGYGPIVPEGYQEVELEMVPEDAREVGTMLMATAPDGQQQAIRVHEVKEETIVLDFNHPLAGQALNFDVKILAID